MAKKPLRIDAKITDQGLTILVDKRPFRIKWPKKIWAKTPVSVKEALKENLACATTNFLPLILNKEKIVYGTGLPLLEPYIFKNQLFDITDSEWQDDQKPLAYFKPFYNLEVEFSDPQSTLIEPGEVPPFKNKKAAAVIPFTFGKESLTTFALCRELGIKPILVYCQEPAHPHEEKLKRRMLEEFRKKYGAEVYFIENETGLFRYGKAFNKKNGTEIGWAAQTTILAMLSVPFALHHQAEYIFFGSEHSNNEFEMVDGWKVHCSYDQTSGWTPQQSNMIRLLTNNRCRVHSILEPLEEINILFLLAHRYPELSRWLFSCGSKNPLLEDSQWCHRCDKCERIYAFAESLGFDPKNFGFKKEIIRDRKYLNNHFKGKGDIDLDLEFALMVMLKKCLSYPCLNDFKRSKIKKFQNYGQHTRHYTGLQPAKNLPPKYAKQLLKIYTRELEALKKTLPH